MLPDIYVKSWINIEYRCSYDVVVILSIVVYVSNVVVATSIFSQKITRTEWIHSLMSLYYRYRTVIFYPFDLSTIYSQKIFCFTSMMITYSLVSLI